MRSSRRAKDYLGFTLAEVLITLGIIGIVAAMTIPTLMARHQEQEFVSKFKETYSIISQAYIQSAQKYGNADTWGLNKTNDEEESKKMFEYLSPYLKIDNNIGFRTSSPRQGIPSSWRYINDKGELVSYAFAGTMYYFYMANGTLVAVNNYATNPCVWVDLNGYKKPNVIGKDFFLLYLTSKNGAPFITYPKERILCSTTDPGGGNHRGTSCAYWVLTRGNMDYLHRDVQAEW